MLIIRTVRVVYYVDVNNVKTNNAGGVPGHVLQNQRFTNKHFQQLYSTANVYILYS